MHTVFDWTALALFCGLAILFLHRSVGPRLPGDRTVLYLPPALACAAANLLGNAGWALTAGALLALAGGYTVYVLKPWRSPPG